MGRSEEKQVQKQAQANSGQDQANAQGALGATNTALGNYTDATNRFLKFGRKTYGDNGDFIRTQNTLANTAAKAGSDALGGDLALHSLQTGENTAGYGTAAAEDRRARQRDVTDFMAQSNADRLKNLTAINQYEVEAGKFPATVQEQLYGTSLGGANAALGTAQQAASTPSFWDQFSHDLIQGGATVGAAFCPCAGSMVRIGNETDMPVEQLEQGTVLWTMGSSAPANTLMETPRPRREPCLEIVTAKGRRHRGSKTHAIMLARGGYAPMPELKGQIILASLETDEVVEVIDIGEQTVYPMAVSGSHCYMADSIWCLA